MIIVPDALRADRVGALSGGDLTPNIDDFASEATVFSNAFTTATATEPAITSIQTGRHPLSNGIVNHGGNVTAEQMKTVEKVDQLPKILSDEGYHTAKMGRPLGRWHRDGFHVYPSISEGKSPMGTENPKNLKGRISNRLNEISPMMKDAVARGYQTFESYFDPALDAVDETVASGGDKIEDQIPDVISRDKPFYGFVHLMDTHGPFDVDSNEVESLLRSKAYDELTLDEIRKLAPDAKFISEMETEIRNWDRTDHSIGELRSATYDAAVKKTDRRIGWILERLKTTGVLEQTLVVIAADHGESLTEHGIYFSHHHLYDQTMHIPLLIRPPGGKHGSTDEMVQLTDIAPTVLDYVGIEADHHDGNSLKSVIDNGEQIDRSVVLAEERNNNRRRAFRTNEQKLIKRLDDDSPCWSCGIEHGADVELYDLLDDPGETQNIAEQSPDVVEEMSGRMEALVNKYKSRRPTVDMDEREPEYTDQEELIDQMKQLGYRQ